MGLHLPFISYCSGVLRREGYPEGFEGDSEPDTCVICELMGAFGAMNKVATKREAERSARTRFCHP
eukprot:scaffold39733_cov17-Tisochrysis_lutea.AAC.1